MSLTVPIEVRNETNKCDKNFRCLECGICRCEVLYAGGTNVLFVKPKDLGECGYCFKVSTGWLCLCPTNYEWHKPMPGRNALDG